MNHLKSLLLLAAILLGGCATVGVESVQKLTPQNRIVALSLLGDSLAVRHVGTTVFQNEQRDVSVADWQLDSYAEATARRQLQADGKFVPVEGVTSATRAAAGKLGSDFWTSRTVVQGGPDSLTALAAQAKADYILVIGPAQIGDPFMRTNQNISGYGIYQREAFGRRRALNYLTMSLALFDGKTGAEVGRVRGSQSGSRSDTMWLDSKALAPPAGNMAATKAAVESLTESLLRRLMRDLKISQ